MNRYFAAIAGIVAVIVCAGLIGCADQNKVAEEPVYVVPAGPPLSPEAIASAYNPSVVKVDRLWARTELRITGTDDKGEAFDETAEGHFQFIRPRGLALTVNKLGETYFCLGSNDTQYWWMDLRKPRNALLGDHAKASPRIAARFGVPVHPLDLIDLMGILPVQAKGSRTAWSKDGRHIVLSGPSRWGRKEMLFSSDGRTLMGVRLLTSRNELLCESELGETSPIEFREAPDATAIVPVRITLHIPSRGTEVSIRLYDPQNRGAAMKKTVFDPQALLTAYNIESSRVRLIDQEPSATPARTIPPTSPSAATPDRD